MANEKANLTASREAAKTKNFEAQIQIWNMLIELQAQKPSDDVNARIAICYNRLREAGSNLLVLDGNAFYEFQGDSDKERIP